MHSVNHLLSLALGVTTVTATLSAQHPTRLRCGTPAPQAPIGTGIDHPDCDYYQTNPSSAYAPTSLLRIAVVVHVIQNNSGTGNLSNATVNSQITVLNEDFRAMAGTPGANGVDSQIEFYLATTDPNGQPTSGILHHTNNNWFNDSGNYYGSTAWDTSRYLNIYTNQASGSLGYVPDLPQGGSVLGTSADRIVCYYATFGRPGSYGAPFAGGRTATHEVGHYLGLFHTFNGGCGGGSCYTSGDRICDTNAESQPRYGCPTTATSCGSVDPVRNYMDYSDDTCMQGFTAEQVRRMRCTLQHYRPQLAQPGGPTGPLASATSRTGAGNFNSGLTCTAPRLGENVLVTAVTVNTGMTASTVHAFLQPGSTPFQGYTILVDITSPQLFTLPLQSGAIYTQWTFLMPNDPGLAGLPYTMQALMLSPSSPGGPPFGLSNAMDCTAGT